MTAVMFCAVTLLSAFVDTVIAVDTIGRYDSIVELKDIEISDNQGRSYDLSSSQVKINIGKEYLENHFEGSLMQTLEQMPGIKAMTIGSSQSKPTIRGLGFNRMLVAENGIKHEGQQWGDDHGLEINQFGVNRIEIIKGPSALLYGSDAIGGVLNLFTNYVPLRKAEGSASVFFRSNNMLTGTYASVGGNNGTWFYRLDASYSDYSDYKVPADSIQYYSYWIKLKNRRLKNTAGKERYAGLLLGYAKSNFHFDVKISDNCSKSGFFADAHGLEVRLSEIDYNRSQRDIDLPFQQVNHIKVLTHSVYSKSKFTAELNAAYQNNLRQEHSEPLSHGYMPTPDNTTERKFNKDTYTANLNIMLQLNQSHFLRTGISTEYQDNAIGGWGFIIPAFTTLSYGAYATDKWTVNPNLTVNGGIRCDFSSTHPDAYTDWYITPVTSGDSVYKQRSKDMSHSFKSLTYSLGTAYNKNRWSLKTNIGKSFRIPVPKELAADGINYHIFRYEKGNDTLKAEQAYQLDVDLAYSSDRVAAELDAYANYFPNYIYLNPTAYYTEGMQTYYYTQAEVFRYGFELQCNYKLTALLDMDFRAEYLYSRQLSGQKKGYTLPFSVPFSADMNARYTFSPKQNGYVSAGIHFTAPQNQIVPPEKATDGYFLVNVSAGKHFAIGNKTLKVSVSVKNIFNTRYYDHTSYYRLIDVPEQGRNVSAVFSTEF